MSNTEVISPWDELLQSCSGDKKTGAHCERNQGPILEALHKVLQAAPHAAGTGPFRCLEFGCGTGQHAAFLSQRLTVPGRRIQWHPTDADPVCLKSTALWIEGLEIPVAEPLLVDVMKDISEWPATLEPGSFDLVYNANIIHIAPATVLPGLLASAARMCKPGGLFVMYGPYKENGTAAPSNLAFDQRLKAANPDFGLRNFEDVSAAVERAGFALREKVAMPTNNLLIAWERKI
eukprot:jgi/Mesvir1/23188/Mv22654-RA.1